LGHHQVAVTLAFLTLLAVLFLRGFNEAIGLATFAAIPYLALNLVVLGRGAWEVAKHPVLLADWHSMLAAKGDLSLVIIGAIVVFPRLALGLSGFETGVSVMPLIDGGAADHGYQPRHGGRPEGRIANTRKLLAAAASIMSVMLILSSFVTTLLIQPDDYVIEGKASGRAIAFLAHKYMGSGFGTLYDISTILILGLAGASAMAGLLHVIPRYLPRFGMAPRWVVFSRPLVLLVRHRRCHYAGLPRGCGGPERRLRNRCVGAHLVGGLRGHSCLVARATPVDRNILCDTLPGIRIHARR